MDTIEITLGGKTYRAATVNIATLKRHKQFLQDSASLQEGGSIPAEREIESMFVMTEIIHACIARVEPSVSLAEVEEALDRGNLLEAYNRVMGISGFVAKGDLGEAKPAG